MRLRNLLLILLLPVHVLMAGETVTPDNPAFGYIGRFSADKSFGWSACTIRFELDGGAATGLFTLTKGQEAGLLVITDGVPTKEKLVITKGKTAYPLAENLPAGKHVVEIVKTSEGQIGEVRFDGLQLPAGASIHAVPLKERRILVIGDSLTCGYGNEAEDVNKGNNVRNENAWLCYPAVAARQLNADVVTICWSGRGIFRNRWTGEDRKGTLPEVFDRVLPQSAEPVYDHAAYVPQVIVINLGTNDMNEEGGKKPALRKEDYQTANREFIKRLRTLYPESKLILAIGPNELRNLVGWLAELAKEFPETSTVVFRGKGGKEYLGGHWHPSVKMDQLMGETLAAQISAVTGWK